MLPNRRPEPHHFEAYQAAGADQVIYMVGGTDLDGYLARLDKLKKLA